MRLIQDYGSVFGDDPTHLFALYSQVREEQMMIDNDDVALLRLLVHSSDEASLKLLASLAAA